MSNRFAEIPRGRALSGPRKIASHIWGEKARSVYDLPRDEYGLVILAGQLTGFEGWIDHALAERAKNSKKRRYRRIDHDADTALAEQAALRRTAGAP